MDAPSGPASLCLAPGVHAGPLRVTRRVRVWGPREAVVRAEGEGSTLRIEAAGAELLGLTVDGSGGRFDLLDAAVRVRADDVRVEGVAIRNALFGVLVEQSRRVRVRGNEIEGDPSKPLGLRGDAIRLWEVRESLVEANRVRHARDVVVWYSPGNRIVGNHVASGRYGTHFMYSHDNVVERNRYERNVVGIFVMYSRGIRIRENLLALSAGAAGIGLGLKESGNLDVAGNWFPRNTVGAYIDTSPLQEDEHNRFEANHFVLCDTGVVFHGRAGRNRFRGNEFRDNGSPVRVEGRGDARDADWTGNYWGDYAGYDLDGDGFGDVPYALRSLSQDLAARAPALRLLRGSPAMALVEFVGRAVPLFEPRTLLLDEHPRMRAPEAG